MNDSVYYGDRNHLHGARAVRDERLCLANASRSSDLTSSSSLSSSSDASSALLNCGSRSVIEKTPDFGGDPVCRSFAFNAWKSSTFTFASPPSIVPSALPECARSGARGSSDSSGALLRNDNSSSSRSSLSGLYAMIGSSSPRYQEVVVHHRVHPNRVTYPHVHYVKGRAFPAKGSRHDAIFYILVFIAILVVAVYLMVFALLMTRPERSQAGDLGSSPLGRGQGGSLTAPCAPKVTCISETDTRKAARIMKKNQSEGSESLRELLPADYQVYQEQICFQGQGWLPKWAAKLGEIYVDVISTVNEIQEMQQNINESLSSGPSPPSSQANKTSKSAIYAHFLLDVEGSLNGQAELTVLKLKELSTESNNYGVNFTNSNGELKILHNGFYFVYSYVVFKGNNAPKHEIIKMKMSKTEKLQEAQGGPTSTLQGVFRLHKGDSVYVQASRSQLDTSGSKSSYFGLYLVRT